MLQSGWKAGGQGHDSPGEPAGEAGQSFHQKLQPAKVSPLASTIIIRRTVSFRSKPAPPPRQGVVAECGQQGLTPRGAWLGTRDYLQNDLVTLDGSGWRSQAGQYQHAPHHERDGLGKIRCQGRGRGTGAAGGSKGRQDHRVYRDLRAFPDLRGPKVTRVAKGARGVAGPAGPTGPRRSGNLLSATGLWWPGQVGRPFAVTDPAAPSLSFLGTTTPITLVDNLTFQTSVECAGISLRPG